MELLNRKTTDGRHHEFSATPSGMFLSEYPRLIRFGGPISAKAIGRRVECSTKRRKVCSQRPKRVLDTNGAAKSQNNRHIYVYIWKNKERNFNNNQQWRTTDRLSSLKTSHFINQKSTCQQKNVYLKRQEKCEVKNKMCMTRAVSSRVQCTKARRTEAFCWSYTQPGGRYSFGVSVLLAPKQEAVAWTAEKAVPVGLTTSRKAAAYIDGVSTPMLAIRFALERTRLTLCDDLHVILLLQPFNSQTFFQGAGIPDGSSTLQYQPNETYVEMPYKNVASTAISQSFSMYTLQLTRRIKLSTWGVQDSAVVNRTPRCCVLSLCSTVAWPRTIALDVRRWDFLPCFPEKSMTDDFIALKVVADAAAHWSTLSKSCCKRQQDDMLVTAQRS